MNKILLKNKKEFDFFIGGNTELKKYPCIAILEIKYCGNGPYMMDYELVYPDDFKTE